MNTIENVDSEQKIAHMFLTNVDEDGNQAPIGLQYMSYKLISPFDLPYIQSSNDAITDVKRVNQNFNIEILPIELGIFTLEYCGGCNDFKSKLLNDDIPFVTLQISNRSGVRNDNISKAYEELSLEYGFTGKVPALCDIRDIPSALFKSDDLNISTYNENHYNLISTMAKTFNACIANSRNIGSCIESFVNDYHTYESSVNNNNSYYENGLILGV